MNIKLLLILIFGFLSLVQAQDEELYEEEPVEISEAEQNAFDQGFRKGYKMGFEKGYQTGIDEVTKKMGEIKNRKGLIDQIMNADTTEMVSKIVEPLRQIPEEELRKIIYEKAGGNPIGKFLRDKVWFINWCVGMVKHETALPELAGLLKERKQLWRFIIAQILLVILSLTGKRYIRNRELPTKYRVYHFALMSFLGLFVFWSFFGGHFKPTFTVTWNVLIS